MSDYSWQLEQIMLGIYKLLVHRMKGLGMSLKEFENLMMEMGLIDD